MPSRFFSLICTPLLLAIFLCLNPGCSTVPKEKDQSKLIEDSQTAINWFTENVSGLESQLDRSAGYIIYPGIGQYGIVITGGKFGRGVVYNRNNQQVGWANLNSASAGLQVGAQGFKMLVVFQDSKTMQLFEQNKLTGSAGATAVAIDAGKAGAASFTNGVAVYQGAQSGLMAGASLGLDYMRFAPLDQ